MRTFTLATLCLLATASVAAADPVPGGADDFSRGFGMGWDSFDRPIEPSTRDDSNNRVIVSGRIAIEGALTGGLGDGFGGGVGAAQAIGNQLNVVTQGNWNTVIVDSTQINNGDISAATGD